MLVFFNTRETVPEVNRQEIQGSYYSPNRLKAQFLEYTGGVIHSHSTSSNKKINISQYFKELGKFTGKCLFSGPVEKMDMVGYTPDHPSGS